MGNCASTSASGGVSVLASSSDNTECTGFSDGREPAPSVGRVPSTVVGLVDGAPGVLDVRQWTSNLDVPVVKARATALEAGINSILDPVLDRLLPMLPPSSPPAARLAAAADALPAAAAAAAAAGHAAAATPAAVGGMLTVLNALAAAAAATAPVPAALFTVSSVARLAALAAGAADDATPPSSRTVSEDEEVGSPTAAPGTPTAAPATPPPPAPGAGWATFVRLLAPLGARPAALAVALDAPSKAVLAELEAPTLAPWGGGAASLMGRAHRRVVRLAAPRGGALDAVAAALTAGGLLAGAGCGPASLRVAVAGGDGAGGGGGGGVARGREGALALFASAGAELAGLAPAASPSSPPPLLTFLPAANAVWFVPHAAPSPGDAARCRAAGWLAAQALTARAPLGLPFPPTLFDRLLAGPLYIPSLEALADFDPSAAAAVRAVACAEGPAYAAACAAAGLAPTTPRPLFAAAAAKAALVDSVAWQFDAFAEGWWAGADRRVLARWRWTAADLAAVVGGDPPAHLVALRVRAAAGEGTACLPVPALAAAAAAALPPLPPLRKAERVPIRLAADGSIGAGGRLGSVKSGRGLLGVIDE